MDDLHTKDVIINGVPLLVIDKNGFKEQTIVEIELEVILLSFLKHKVIEPKKEVEIRKIFA